MLWRFWRKLFPLPKVVLQRVPRLTDAEILKALAASVDGVYTFEAILQLIDDFETVCTDAAIGLVDEHGALASEVGGVQVLRELRQKMLELREKGRHDDDEEK